MKITKMGIISLSLFLIFLISSNLYSQIHPYAENEYPKKLKKTEKKETGKSHSINIDSSPQGAEVFLNDELIGKTPITIPQFNEKNATIKAVLDSVTRSEFIQSLNQDYEIFFILDGNYGLLNVQTEPNDANVFIDDSLIGRSPINDLKVDLGKHSVVIQNDDYLSVNYPINIAPKKHLINLILKSKFGYLELLADNNIVYKIDDKPIEKLNDDLKLELGSHSLTAIQKENGKTVSEDFFLSSGQLITASIKYNYFTPKYILYSAFIPGLGQYLDENKYLGGALFGGAVASTAAYFFGKMLYNSKKDDMNAVIHNYNKSVTEEDAYLYGNQLRSLTSEANNAAKICNTSLVVLTGIYLASVVDAILFHTKGRRIEFSAPPNSLSPLSFGLKYKFN